MCVFGALYHLYVRSRCKGGGGEGGGGRTVLRKVKTQITIVRRCKASSIKVMVHVLYIHVYIYHNPHVADYISIYALSYKVLCAVAYIYATVYQR